MKPRIRFSGWFITLYLVCAQGFGADKPPGWDALVKIHYRLEVTNYCGLASDAVINGFRVLNARLQAQYNFDQQQINAIRGEAWAAGYKEWDNRGLGGFRGWCKKEGRSYAAYFLNSR